MRRVIDSSAWIEWLAKTTLGRRLDPEIPTEDECIVPTIVQLEVWKWLDRQIDRPAANAFIAFSSQNSVVALDTAIAQKAAEISSELKLSTADAIIYATARLHDADLLTCDRHFESLPGVVYMSK